jgi:hypothetical protein
VEQPCQVAEPGTICDRGEEIASSSAAARTAAGWPDRRLRSRRRDDRLERFQLAIHLRAEVGGALQSTVAM